jgi:hypothetical protein
VDVVQNTSRGSFYDTVLHAPFGFAIILTVEREKARLVTWLKAYCVFGASAAAVDEDTATRAEANMVLTFIELMGWDL